MAWTNWGFDGTINEAQWAQMAGLLGNDYVASGNGDCLVTAVPGARSVSVAAGTLYGDGVVSVNDAAETVAMTTPVNGQWYVIALRRTWSSNTAALVAIAGATTSTTTPTAPPTSFPTLNANKGVLTDQPIAWAWCNSANTTVVVYDIRMRAVKSLPPVVANQGERDAKFMTPTQGLQVWRDDLGAVETYYGLYNASTNPGGRDSAGWYVSDRQTGMIPIQPTSVVIASGTGSATAIGTVNFTAATTITLNGIFSSKYKNYHVVFTGYASTVAVAGVRLTASGTAATSNYNYTAIYTVSGGSASNDFSSSATYAPMIVQGNNGNSAWWDIYEPATTSYKKFIGQSFAQSLPVTYTASRFAGLADTTVFDGMSIIATSGTLTGSVTVYGFNN